MHGADVFHDLDASFYALTLHREMGCLPANLGYAELADNVWAGFEIDTTLIVRTREVISHITLFIAFFRTKQRRPRQLAYLTTRSPEFLLRKVEIEQFTISCLFDFPSPQGTVHMDELIYVEGDQSAGDFPFAVLFAQDAEELFLGVVY